MRRLMPRSDYIMCIHTNVNLNNINYRIVKPQDARPGKTRSDQAGANRHREFCTNHTKYVLVLLTFALNVRRPNLRLVNTLQKIV